MAESAKNQAEKPINPFDLPNLDSRKEEMNLIKSIVSTESGENAKSLLKIAPQLDQSLLREFGLPKSFFLSFLKWLALAMGLGLIASLIFFTAQLGTSLDFVTERFGFESAAKEVSGVSAEIRNLQNDSNFYRYLKALSYLNRLSFLGDDFLHNFETFYSQTASNSERTEADRKMNELRPQLAEALEKARSELKNPLRAAVLKTSDQSDAQLEAEFESMLKAKISAQAANFANKSDEENRKIYLNYIYTANLVGNKDARDLIMKSDIRSMDDQELYGFVKSLNRLITNDLSIIQAIKENRIKWSDIINEIDMRTAAVDQYYNQGEAYSTLGGIRYTSYDFDIEGPRITVTGETKRFDNLNFTTIVSLIEEMNNSKFFKNGEMRSFSKTGSEDTGYTAVLRLSLDLEEENLNPEN